MAGQCPRRQRRGAGAGRSAAGDRLVYPVEANELFVRMTADEAARAARAGLRFLRLGRRAKSGSSPAGTRTCEAVEQARRGDRGAVSHEPARPTSTVGHRLPFIIFTGIWGSTWIVIRDQLGIGAAAMVGHLPLHHRRRGDGGGRASGRAQTLQLDRGGLIAALFLGVAQFCVNFNASISPSGTSPRAWWRPCSRCC